MSDTDPSKICQCCGSWRDCDCYSPQSSQNKDIEHLQSIIARAKESLKNTKETLEEARRTGSFHDIHLAERGLRIQRTLSILEEAK